MYKTIIINSNNESVIHLKKIFSKNNFGFTIVSSFIYGARVADNIAETLPELIIIDLPSSTETNLDVIKSIHGRFPDTKILLYTCREDIELTKIAVSQGVSGIVSPGNDAELTAVLADIKASLDRMSAQKKRDKLLEQLIISARKQFLTDIFMGNITGKENIQKKADELSLNDKACIYCPFWIAIPSYNEYITTRWSYDKERFLIAIGNFLRSENKKFDIQNIMFTNGEIFYVAIADTEDANNFIASLRLHLTDAELNLKSMLGLNISWHIGKHFMSFHDFVDHITTPILSESNINYEAAYSSEENHALVLDMYKNVVISAILDKTPRLKEHLNYIVRLLSQSAENTLTDTLTEFCEISMQNMAPHLNDNADFKRMMSSLAKANGTNAQSACTGLLLLICREAGKNAPNASSDMIKRAMEYIQDNFTKDLSLEDVAKYLNLNPSYFSRFFKMHTGQNFRDYLIELRVKKAKELLLTGKYKIYEISIRTGYKNSKYFAAQFKSVTGLSPREFAQTGQASSTDA